MWVICINILYIMMVYFLSKRLGGIQNILTLNCFCTFQCSFVTPSALSYIQAFCIPPQQQKNMVPNFKRHSIMKTRDSYVILSTTAADDSIKCSDYQKLHNLIVGFCIYFCWK